MQSQPPIDFNRLGESSGSSDPATEEWRQPAYPEHRYRSWQTGSWVMLGINLVILFGLCSRMVRGDGAGWLSRISVDPLSLAGLAGEVIGVSILPFIGVLCSWVYLRRAAAPATRQSALALASSITVWALILFSQAF